MKALIIDDHKVNRLYLRTCLEKHFSQIETIEESASVGNAVELINSSEYDVVFLDMELKDGVGFDVLKEIKDFIYVIVVTAYKDYAIEAFKYSVVDYLLKPLNESEFVNAVKKVMKLCSKDASAKFVGLKGELVKAKNESETPLMINYKNKLIALDKKDIVFIKALGKHSEIHVNTKDFYTSYKNLKEFETAMTASFVRIHHSYLVNLDSIVSYSRDTSHVTLSNGEDIPVSVRKRDDLFKRFRVF
ncbi:hypothetical protein CNR22_05915 [Sphingobacteriaceae bacterium]|nr:hypothetical protein CNR22_05915 [Sphingobacteriaceae bacterium]